MAAFFRCRWMECKSVSGYRFCLYTFLWGRGASEIIGEMNRSLPYAVAARKEVAWHMLYPHLATRGDGNKLHLQSSQLLSLLGDTDESEGLQLVESR